MKGKGIGRKSEEDLVETREEVWLKKGRGYGGRREKGMLEKREGIW
jgi:hypothetical protein